VLTLLRRLSIAGIARATALAIALSACTAAASVAPGYSLPTSVGEGCRGVGVDSLILHGKLVDGAAEVWANDHTPIQWPAGYEARFDPLLVIVDAQDTVRGREGEEMVTVDPWHGQVVCPYDRQDGDAVGSLLVAVSLPNPPLPTPEGSRPCSAVRAELTAALPILGTDLAAMVGGATDGATRNQLASDAYRTLEELDRHPDCYAEATMTVWRADLDYLGHPWLPSFTRVKASAHLDELLKTPFH
jgi:hypothetical protein